MKKHTAVALLCTAIAAAGLLLAPKDGRELSYMSGTAQKRENEGTGTKRKGADDGKDYIKWVEYEPE